MPLSELLNPDRIAVLGEAVDRDGVLAHAARLLAVDSVDDAAVIAECLRMRERLNEILVHHTGQPFKRIQEDTERDYIMSADQGKEYGIIDDVIRKRV